MIVDSKDMNWIGKVNFEGGKVYTSGKTIFFPNNIYFLTWKDIDERVKDYDYIVFTENEFFLNEELTNLLRYLKKCNLTLFSIFVSILIKHCATCGSTDELKPAIISTLKSFLSQFDQVLPAPPTFDN